MGERSLAPVPRTPGVIAGRVFIYTLLGISALYFLLPFFVMVITSFKTMEDIRTGTLISLPREISLEAWSEAWSSACIGVNCQGIKGDFITP
jgi:glucose/mannose transport system permease protein